MYQRSAVTPRHPVYNPSSVHYREDAPDATEVALDEAQRDAEARARAALLARGIYPPDVIDKAVEAQLVALLGPATRLRTVKPNVLQVVPDPAGPGLGSLDPGRYEVKGDDKGGMWIRLTDEFVYSHDHPGSPPF